MLALGIRTVLMLLSMSAVLWAISRAPRPMEQVWMLTGGLTLIAMITEVYGLISTYYQMQNVIGYLAYTLLELVVILLLVGQLAPTWSFVLWCAGLAMVSAFTINCLVNDGLDFMPTEGLLVEACMLSIILLVLLYKMAATSIVPLQHRPHFWLLMGLLIYFGGMVPVVGVARIVYEQDQVLSQLLWSIMPILCIIRYALAAYAGILLTRADQGQVHADH